jgi:hypothetical protein
MAKKKGKRPQIVPPFRDDRNIIRIEREPLKVRAPILPGHNHHTRELDVKKGRRRHPKHKSNGEW